MQAHNPKRHISALMSCLEDDVLLDYFDNLDEETRIKLAVEWYENDERFPGSDAEKLFRNTNLFIQEHKYKHSFNELLNDQTSEK